MVKIISNVSRAGINVPAIAIAILVVVRVVSALIIFAANAIAVRIVFRVVRTPRTIALVKVEVFAVEVYLAIRPIIAESISKPTSCEEKRVANKHVMSISQTPHQKQQQVRERHGYAGVSCFVAAASLAVMAPNLPDKRSAVVAFAVGAVEQCVRCCAVGAPVSNVVGSAIAGVAAPVFTRKGRAVKSVVAIPVDMTNRMPSR